MNKLSALKALHNELCIRPFTCDTQDALLIRFAQYTDLLNEIMPAVFDAVNASPIIPGILREKYEIPGQSDFISLISNGDVVYWSGDIENNCSSGYWRVAKINTDSGLIESEDDLIVLLDSFDNEAVVAAGRIDWREVVCEKPVKRSVSPKI